MGLQDLLNTFVSNLNLVGGGGVTPGALITAGLNPDPTQTVLGGGVPGATRTTVLLKMLRFSDSTLPDAGTSISDFIATVGQVLGGQAMPAISVELPGPALPGARIPVTQLSGGGGINSLAGLNIAQDVPASATLPAQPSLGPDAGTDTSHDVLSGVPGIVGVIESGLASSAPLRVSLTWTFAVANGPTATLSGLSLSALSIVPPVMFYDMQSPSAPPTLFDMTITVTGKVYVPDPRNPTDPQAALASATINLSTSMPVQFPGIPVPRLLGLFTWPQYGTEATSGDSNPDDSSLLLMYPADSQLTDTNSVTAAFTSVRSTAGPITSLLSGPLGASTVAPFASPTVVVQQLSALLAGLDRVTKGLSVPSHNDYVPVTLRQASAPSDNSPTRGGLSDLNGIWWDKENLGLDHDYYHDHAKSLLWLALPQAQVVVYRDSKFKWNNDHGRLTLTTGDTCLAGIPDFRPHPDTLDMILSPSLPGLNPANAQRDGWFTNEHPPNSEDNWAWTDSVEFL
jgi:hypothetical protein